MKQLEKRNHPWLVAVWPGMGHVASNAGYYLMAKLGMECESELDARELFEMNNVEVHGGIIHSGHLPRNRFFVWRDPKGQRDLLVFLGEAQPPVGVHAYCRRIIDHARALGVEQVFTFAAMATQMQLAHKSRVFGAATNPEALNECRRLELEILQEGQISGLNGVLLGVAAERGLSGTCLLGEMPHIFSQLSFPRASLAVLESFEKLSGIPIDLTDLREQAKGTDEQLALLMTKVHEAIREEQGGETPAFGPLLEPEEEPAGGIDPRERERLEELFAEARRERSKAYRLKQELDRLKVFPDYEDRFLDLFGGNGEEDGDDTEQRRSA